MIRSIRVVGYTILKVISMYPMLRKLEKEFPDSNKAKMALLVQKQGEILFQKMKGFCLFLIIKVILIFRFYLVI